MKFLMLLILDANNQNTKLGIIAHYKKKCLEATMEENYQSPGTGFTDGMKWKIQNIYQF